MINNNHKDNPNIINKINQQSSNIDNNEQGPFSTYDPKLAKLNIPSVKENKNIITPTMAYGSAFGLEKHEVNGFQIDYDKVPNNIDYVPIQTHAINNNTIIIDLKTQNPKTFNCASMISKPLIIDTTQQQIINGNINLGNSSNVSDFKGLKDCLTCVGNGFRVSKNGKLKPCKTCVRQTGNCGVCNNTGYKLYSGKKCKCTKLKKLK